jgi:hypothetical protein
MNLNSLNLVELNAQEVQEVDGGFWGEVAGGVLLYGIVSAIDYPDSFIDGLLGR